MIGSDGGDGLLDALGGRLTRRTQVIASGPLGAPVAGDVGWLDDNTAIVESRMFCGLALLGESGKKPLHASTRGVGEVLLQLGNVGARAALIGLGGSASVDGGSGFARALGWGFSDERGGALAEGGGALADCARIVPAPRVGMQVIGLADVRNPLLGPGGALVYAPQKGADPEAMSRLGRGLERLVALLASADPAARERAMAPAAGAAGGLGFGVLHFAGGELRSGAAWVLEAIGFDAALADADAVITGEGAFDATSWEGKLTGEVIRRARRAGKPVALVAPRVAGAPEGVVVESGGGRWSEGDLAAAAERALKRLLRLPLA